MSRLVAEGMLLESARGPITSVAALVAGDTIRGSWWAHPRSHAIYATINAIADSPDVVRLRLVNGRITLVHRRVWPALVALEQHFPAARLAAVAEEHTSTGAHRSVETPFAQWIPASARRAAAGLRDDAAWVMLPECLRPSGQPVR
jgi:hypothetical protein